MIIKIRKIKEFVEVEVMQTLKQLFETLLDSNQAKARMLAVGIARNASIKAQVEFLGKVMSVIKEEVDANDEAWQEIQEGVKKFYEHLHWEEMDRDQIKKDAVELYEYILKYNFKSTQNLRVVFKGLSGPLYSSNVLPYNPPDAKINKKEVKENVNLSSEMPRYLFSKPKSGGANAAGEKGGEYVCLYQDSAKPDEPKIQRLLIKQDTTKSGVTNHDKNIAEFVSGGIMNTVIGDSAARVFLVNNPAVASQDKNGKDVYIASPFYSHYKDLYVRLYEIYNANEIEHKRPPLKIPKDRPKYMGSDMTPAAIEFRKVFKYSIMERYQNGNPTGRCRFADFEKVAVAALLVGDYDVHTGNYGVVSEPGQPERLVKIDHAAAFDHIEDDVHMHSHRRHKPFVGPTNHLREYPRAMKISKPFAEELDRQANVSREEITKSVNARIDKVAECYGAVPISQFAERLGVDLSKLKLSKENDKKQLIVDEAKRFLIEKMIARQQSMKCLSLEIKISLCVKKKESGGFALTDRDYKLDELIKQNPSYFKRGKFHLRLKGQRRALRAVGSLWNKSKAIELIKERAALVFKQEEGSASDLIKTFHKKDLIFNLSYRAKCLYCRLEIFAGNESVSENHKLRMRECQKLLQSALHSYSQNPKVKARLVMACDEAIAAMSEFYGALSDAQKKVLDNRLLNKKSESAPTESDGLLEQEELINPVEYLESFTSYNDVKGDWPKSFVSTLKEPNIEYGQALGNVTPFRCFTKMKGSAARDGKVSVPYAMVLDNSFLLSNYNKERVISGYSSQTEFADNIGRFWGRGVKNIVKMMPWFRGLADKLNPIQWFNVFLINPVLAFGEFFCKTAGALCAGNWAHSWGNRIRSAILIPAEIVFFTVGNVLSYTRKTVDAVANLVSSSIAGLRDLWKGRKGDLNDCDRHYGEKYPPISLCVKAIVLNAVMAVASVLTPFVSVLVRRLIKGDEFKKNVKPQLKHESTAAKFAVVLPWYKKIFIKSSPSVPVPQSVIQEKQEQVMEPEPKPVPAVADRAPPAPDNAHLITLLDELIKLIKEIIAMLKDFVASPKKEEPAPEEKEEVSSTAAIISSIGGSDDEGSEHSPPVSLRQVSLTFSSLNHRRKSSSPELSSEGESDEEKPLLKKSSPQIKSQ